MHKNGARTITKGGGGRGNDGLIARWGLQWRVLLTRAWRQVKRDKATAIARLMSNLSSAFIFGSIYWRLGRRQDGIQNRMGLLQVPYFHGFGHFCLLQKSVLPINAVSQVTAGLDEKELKFWDVSHGNCVQL